MPSISRTMKIKALKLLNQRIGTIKKDGRILCFPMVMVEVVLVVVTTQTSIHNIIRELNYNKIPQIIKHFLNLREGNIMEGPSQMAIWAMALCLCVAGIKIFRLKI